jgi:hypothetical protein
MPVRRIETRHERSSSFNSCPRIHQSLPSLAPAALQSLQHKAELFPTHTREDLVDGEHNSSTQKEIKGNMTIKVNFKESEEILLC